MWSVVCCISGTSVESRAGKLLVSRGYDDLCVDGSKGTNDFRAESRIAVVRTTAGQIDLLMTSVVVVATRGLNQLALTTQVLLRPIPAIAIQELVVAEELRIARFARRRNQRSCWRGSSCRS